MTKTRVRNLALPLGLAAAAAILIGIYVISYRNSVTHGAGLVKVMVATRDIPAGTDGSTIAGGGYLKAQTVPRRSVVPGSITSAAPLTSKVTSAPIYQGEQITLRQFVPLAQGGIFAEFSGNQRVVVVPGDPNQMLAGTVQEGDHVDVVVTAKYHIGDLARATSRVALRNLLVLKAPDDTKQASVGGAPTTATTLVMTDRQAQTMAWAMKQGSWFFVLRPTNKPLNSSPTVETLFSILGRGLPAAPRQIAGNFPESIDAP
ncbi:MAG TPA: Flp pilus assembly protein CpaB [Gaiellaceae bacterium]|nr:Flp pilus assembly protein CpaB [Gaiellaceae bacterium]